MHAQSLWRTLVVLAALCFGMAEWSAYAQVSGKAFEGFGGRSKDPIQIEADEISFYGVSDRRPEQTAQAVEVQSEMPFGLCLLSLQFV